jgi:hypothetical protein
LTLLIRTGAAAEATAPQRDKDDENQEKHPTDQRSNGLGAAKGKVI